MIPLLEKASHSKLTTSQKILLDYIQENPKRFIHQNLQDICDSLYISNATIVRFCQQLGFCGFNEFKFELRKQLNEQHENKLSEENLFEEQFSAFKDYIDMIPFEQIEKIYQMLHSHSTIYIYGTDMSSISANYLFSILSSLDYPCIYVDWRHLLRGIAENTDTDTLFILMLFQGNVERYQEILLRLKENNTEVVIISDAANDTIRSLSTVFINTNEPSINVNSVDFNFKINTLILVQTLIDMIYSRTEHRQQ